MNIERNLHSDASVPPYKNNGEASKTSGNLKSSKTSPRCILVVTVLLIVIVITVGVTVGIVLSKKASNSTLPRTPDVTVSSSLIAAETTSATTSRTTSRPLNPVVGQWSAWSPWSSCDKTCGTGTYTQSRTCYVTPCLGLAVQQDSCYEEDCPSIADSYGKWEPWGTWSSCSQTCDTGTQERSRLCKKTLGQYDCVGNVSQSRGCNDGSCPPEECTLDCDDGYYGDCLACVCNGNTVTGKVLTQSGAPLQYVKLTYENYSHTIIETTDASGHFDLDNFCLGDTLQFAKDGYLPEVKTIQNSQETIRLQRIEILRITKEPTSAAVLTGECVRLTCEANGYPGPDYYEWYRDDLLVTPHDGNNNLTISAISADHGGSYRCRASNDYSAVSSRTIAVTVEDSVSEICDAIPRSHIITLPTGCEINGRSEVDAGTCAPTKCASGREGKCEATTPSKCGVTRYETSLMQCPHYALPIDIAKECGCIQVLNSKRIFTGSVFSAEDNSKFLFDVTINGQSTKTSYGSFLFEIPSDITRITVSIKDRQNKYFSQSAVVTMNEDVLKYDHEFHLKPKLAPVTFASNEECVLEVGSGEDKEPDCELGIAPNSFYDADGELFDGQVNGFVNNYDTRDPMSMRDAPGDFTSVNSEGESDFLESAGMMYMEFTDDNGNPLNVNTNISVSFFPNISDSSDDSTIADMKLWSLDDNGRWAFMSDMTVADESQSRRRKRQINNRTGGLGMTTEDINGIDVTNRWLNFDAISRSMCYSKVKIYHSNNLISPIREPISVQVVTLQGQGASINTVSGVRANGDSGPAAQCIAHPCDKGIAGASFPYRGVVMARDSSGKYLFPVNQSSFYSTLDVEIDHINNYIRTDLSLVKSRNGPFYDYQGKWRYSPGCVNARPTDNAFLFYKKVLTCETIVLPDNNLDITTMPDRRLAFYSSKYEFGRYERIQACFMRVAVETSVSKFVIAALSYTEDSPTPPDRNATNFYGIRQQCVENKSYACLEYKAPGTVYHSLGLDNKRQEDTRVIVQLEGSYGTTHITLKSALDVTSDLQKIRVDMMLKDNEASHDKGLYCETREATYDEVVKLAKAQCEQGLDWAVRFY